MTPSRGSAPTLEQAIEIALAGGDEERAAAMLRHAFGREPLRGRSDLPELLEELTEYFVAADRPEDAISAASRAVLMTPDSGVDHEVLRRRCRIAEVLLNAGLLDEAYAVYAAIAEQVPTEAWVHEAAGSDYLDAGELEFALAWLTAGLHIAMAAGDDLMCIARLLGLRRVAMSAMGRGADELDVAAGALLAASDEGDSGDADVSVWLS